MLDRFNVHDQGQDIDSLNQALGGIDINDSFDSELRGMRNRLLAYHKNFLNIKLREWLRFG